MALMTPEESEARRVLRDFGETLARVATDETWAVADLVRHMRTRADLAEAHAESYGYARRVVSTEQEAPRASA